MGVTYSTKWCKHLIACVSVEGINVTNQDSQLKYDERHTAKRKRDKEMEERQKIGWIKREQMGHEGVDNALA